MSRVPPGSLPKVPLWIDNQAVQDAADDTVILSRAGKPRCELVTASSSRINEAVASSARAFKAWRRAPAYDRHRVLTAVSRLLPARFDALSEAHKRDAVWADALLGADRRTAVNVVDGAAALSIGVDGWIPQTVDNSLALVLREPYGPTLSIPAFNYPLTLALRSIVYPIACGNTVIMKSSIHVPQAHHLLGQIFADAGLPPGVLQILNLSEESVAQGVSQMIAHDDVRFVNFTGSTRLGRDLAAQCGRHLKPSVMELGGKSAALVLPGADVDVAANNILFASMFHSGQICMSTERAIVHADLYAPFVASLRALLRTVRTSAFELVRPGAPAELRALIDDAVGRGATVLSTPTFSETGATPTVLADVAPMAAVYATETFAPVLVVERAESVEHAVELANAHESGLTAAVYSDVGAALGVARELDAGAVHINSMTIHDEHGLPHGGWKSSGWGRFNGRGALESFTQTKNVTIGNGARMPLAAL
ncbi:hypothetical protein Q5752_006943 [Cryptotrichosporon argae]